MIKKILCALFIAALSISPVLGQDFEVVTPQSTPQTLSIQNEFIKIIVNQTSQDMGRFAVETTGGDPQNNNDNDQPLIYGRPVPWTSYTTILVDDSPYVFGGESKKLLRRVGKSVTFGSVLSQVQDGSSIVTVASCGPVQAIQRLSFLRNPSTKIKDTALIAYELKNEDSVPHVLGVRIMVDTKLGSNDGAPFRIGNYGINSEIKFSKSELQDYWQTFDSLESPNVIAQGTLFQPQSGITPPDQLSLVNWGTLVDNPWNFEYEKGRPFIRAGEEENDTALAMYWMPITVNPGESRIVRTAYGLGGVSLSAGELSIGLTSPSEIFMDSQQELLLVGYISNSGGIDAKKIKAQFVLPPDFEVSKGKSSSVIETLGAGATQQFSIKIKLSDSAESGKRTITFKADSDTLESNNISRTIEIIAPPKLDIKLSAPENMSNSLPGFVTATMVIKNPSSYTFDKIQTVLTTDDTFAIPSFDISTKTIPTLRPNESAELNWVLALKNPNAATGKIKIDTQSKPLKQQSLTRTISLIPIKQRSQHRFSKKDINQGDYFYIETNLVNVKPSEPLSLQIQFDPDSVRFVRASAETLLLTNEIPIFTNDELIEIKDIPLKEKKKEIPISKLHFKALQPGATTFTITENGALTTTINCIINKEQ